MAALNKMKLTKKPSVGQDKSKFKLSKKDVAFIKIVWLLATCVCLPFVDQVTDIRTSVILAGDGHTNWSNTTIVLIFLPSILRLLFAITFATGESRSDWRTYIEAVLFGLPFISEAHRFYCILTESRHEKRQTTLVYTAMFEIVGESAPQFILQLSIAMRLGFISPVEQGVGIAMSCLSIMNAVAKLFTLELKLDKITHEIFVGLMVSLMALPKLASWAFLLAYLRLYVLVPVAVDMAMLFTAHVMWFRSDLKMDLYIFNVTNFVIPGAVVFLNAFGGSIFCTLLLVTNLVITAAFVRCPLYPYGDDLPLAHDAFFEILAFVIGGLVVINLVLESLFRLWVKHMDLRISSSVVKQHFMKCCNNHQAQVCHHQEGGGEEEETPGATNEVENGNDNAGEKQNNEYVPLVETIEKESKS